MNLNDTSSGTSQSTSEMILGVGLASFGMSAKVFHAPFLAQHKGFTIKRIVERSTNEARTLYPGAIVSRSFTDMLNNPDIDLIVVNTPDHTHFELAKSSLEAGKHVVVEKPFTQTVREAEELVELAIRRQRILTVFQNRRWDGDFLTVQDIVRKKTLGRLVEFEARWDRYRNFIQAATWKEDASTGTGLLYNLGSHLIDQALVLFGMPTGVTAHLKILRTGGSVDDWFDVRLHYSDVNVAIKASYLALEPGPRFLLHGTNGSFIKHGIDPQEDALKQGRSPLESNWGSEFEDSWGVLSTEENGVVSRKKIETVRGNYGAFYDNLYESITRGKELAVKPRDALNVIAVIEAAKQSSASRTTVTM
jgi:scyllo-inositol 2-dehydrogenase (NADP+)